MILLFLGDSRALRHYVFELVVPFTKRQYFFIQHKHSFGLKDELIRVWFGKRFNSGIRFKNVSYKCLIARMIKGQTSTSHWHTLNLQQISHYPNLWWPPIKVLPIKSFTSHFVRYTCSVTTQASNQSITWQQLAWSRWCAEVQTSIRMEKKYDLSAR